MSFDETKIYSDKIISELRAKLHAVSGPDTAVVVFGSVARREASDQSDIDYLILKSNDAAQTSEQIGAAIKSAGLNPPSVGGAFGCEIARNEFFHNLGGDEETNNMLTRRLLLLLEGEWLSSQALFDDIRDGLIGKYVQATPNDHQLARFLLNDIIRYWRTMTVDYMYKTTERNKDWAIRNIKLIFSRKLMYASGLFAVGMTADLSVKKKASELSRLFKLPPRERLADICGGDSLQSLFRSYDFFLTEMGKTEVSGYIEKYTARRPQHEIFRELKNEGTSVTHQLMSAFDSAFHSSHPIRRAALF